MPPTIAIIMRAKNEMPHVQQSLAMLRKQTFQNFDLFAVDSGSTDGTLEALQSSCPGDRLMQIAPEEYVPGKVLNRAIVDTDHEIIVLLNADAIPCSEDFLEKLIQPLFEDTADAVFAKQVPRPDARFVVTYDYQRAYDESKMAATFFSAVACAFRRSYWEGCRFREEGYAEDLAWANACLAEGARIRFMPEAVVEHSHNYTLGELYRKRRRQAATFDQPPNLARQTLYCIREIVRDLMYACRELKLHTIPYNVAYRITIHAAIHAGLKYRAGNPTC